MTTQPSINTTVESLTNPLTLLGLVLVGGSLVVASLALREGDVVTAIGMGLMLISGVLATGIGLSNRAD